MNTFEALRQKVVTTVTGSTPKAFWDEMRQFTLAAYRDVYQQVAGDPNLVDQQRLTKLYQDRHFRMEHTLASLAKKHEIPFSSTLAHVNGCNFVYVAPATGSLGFTQSYVPAIGEMPNPAAYWEKLAKASAIPRLDLGDEPSAVLSVKSIYGLITHNPVGKSFSEQHQKLGMIQFCVPSADAKRWAVELTIEEIVSAYEPVIQESGAEPVLKVFKKAKESQ